MRIDGTITKNEYRTRAEQEVFIISCSAFVKLGIDLLDEVLLDIYAQSVL